MAEILLEQAMLEGADRDYIPVGRSPGFRDDWLAEAQRLCAGFGFRPAGARCPSALFAQPLDRRTVAVVQVSERGATRSSLSFRVLAVSRHAYEDAIGNPFTIDEQFSPEWGQQGDLPVLVWPHVPVPYRTVPEIQRILQRSEGPALLGGVQVLVDGGRVVFERPAPDRELIKDLWDLLPARSRSELWPATFAFSNALHFHALVMQRADDDVEGYVSESQAEHYPEGSYELSLQTAAEAGDQAELDAVFSRRSANQVWRLSLILVIVAVLLAATSRLVLPPPAAPRPPAKAVPATPQGVSPTPKPAR